MRRLSTASHSPTRRLGGNRVRAIVLAVALTAGAPPVLALSLGNAEVSSFLGQPLQLRVPVILDDPNDGTTQCPRIVPQPNYDVPTLALGRADIERGVTQSWLRVTTPLPVDEPVLRVVLEIGCTQRVRREFTILLDPPAGMASGTAPVAATAPRLEFGAPEVVGVRGQPLLMAVPIQGELAQQLTSACVRPGRSDSGELPRVLNDARVTLIERPGGRALRIHTPDAVNDARVRVLVEVGCDQPIRREFVVLIDAPRLAAAASEETVQAPVITPPKRVEKPPVPRPAVAPKPVAAAPVAVARPAAAETPATQKPDAPSVEPTRVPARAPTAQTDRLVLAAPEDTPRAVAPRAEDAAKGASARPDETPKPADARPETTAAEREQVMKRLEALAIEVKTLRAELDASAKRNRELSEKARSASYAWAAAAGAALLLGIGILLGWKNRPRREEPAIDSDREGPMTRILGKSAERGPVAPLAPAPSMTDGAGPNTVAAIVAAHRAAHEQDTQTASTAIQVTEFRDTTQVIGELYSPYVDRSASTSQGPATQPAAPSHGANDLDLSNERQTAFAPHTKTEIAVDIDLFERNSQIGRDLQREYERLDLAGRAKEPPPADPASQLDSTTMPMTTKLALDLDLDMPTITQHQAPKKGD